MMIVSIFGRKYQDRQIGGFKLELQTKVGEDFTIKEKAPTKATKQVLTHDIVIKDRATLPGHPL